MPLEVAANGSNVSLTLQIDREFHRLLHPMPDVNRQSDDNVQDRERQRRREWRLRLRDRQRLVTAQIKLAGRVAPFETWLTDDGKQVIIDGRDMEYVAASRLGMPFTTNPRQFESREHAKSHMISRVLINEGKPNYTPFYRIFLATECKYITDFERQAKQNQGRRTDILAQAPKCRPALNTRKEIAALADCGEGLVGKARQLEKYGDMYLGTQRWKEIRDALVTGDMKIGNAAMKLEDAIQSREEVAAQAGEDDTATADGVKPQGKPESHPKHPKFPMRTKPKMALGYDNPDLQEKNENVIICGDSATVMEQLPEGHAGLVLGSIHYNVDMPYEGRDFRKPHEQWLNEDLAPVVVQAARVLRNGGRFILNVSDTFDMDPNRKRTGVEVPVHADVIRLVRDLNVNLHYRTTKIWLKFIRPQRAPIGSIGSPSNPQNYISHEWVIVWSLGDNQLPPPTPNTPYGMTRDEYRQWSIGHWYIAPVSSNKGDHPCPFPESLAERIIKLYSWPGDLVIDPWVGSGTTTAVAARLQRRWLGIDITEKYCSMARYRTLEAQQKWLVQAEKLREQRKEKQDAGADPSTNPDDQPLAEAVEYFCGDTGTGSVNSASSAISQASAQPEKEEHHA